MRQETVDLREEALEMWYEEIPELEDAIEQYVAKLREEYGSFENVPQRKVEAYDELEAEKVELEGYAKAIARALVEWDPRWDAEEYRENGELDESAVLSDLKEMPADGSFVITELSTGDVAAVQDEVREASFDFDPETGDVEGVPKQGFGMLEVLRHAIVDWPEGAPTARTFGEETAEPGDYPHQVGLFLFEKVNALNTTGEADMGNSSLRERMEE